jgi:hypothetical protein
MLGIDGSGPDDDDAGPFVAMRAAADAKQAVQDAGVFHNLKGVLFDIDGTLTNSDPLHFKA